MAGVHSWVEIVSESKSKEQLLQAIADAGGLKPGVASSVSKALGVTEAEVYGAGSFYHLLDEPDVKLRVCTGLSCAMANSRDLLKAAEEAGMPVKECSCLAACDKAPALLRERRVLVEVSLQNISDAKGDWQKLYGTQPDANWQGTIGAGEGELAMDLAGELDFSGAAFQKAQSMGAEAVMAALEESGLQGRGGAGFPAAIKWRGVRKQAAMPHYIALNADEGEPGTFKDRELMMRRPDLVIEGLAIAAVALQVRDVYLYLRGEFEGPWNALQGAIEKYSEICDGAGIVFHLHSGHGAYICGEETALMEALEGKRGMPRIKPPYPAENGLWGKPTLIQNVETIACVPSIINKGGQWFKALGRREAGTKLYSISGDVKCPGTYEMPLGVTLDELVDAAGGYLGTLLAFSPGGASSGFLPAQARDCALDFSSLAKRGSMLGSAGVVVLNESRSIPEAVREQLVFFENESCGQCAPCRIGTRFLREALDSGTLDKHTPQSLAQVADVAWEMNEGSICGLGQAAALPLTTALKHFPEAFGADVAKLSEEPEA